MYQFYSLVLMEFRAKAMKHAGSKLAQSNVINVYLVDVNHTEPYT